MGIGVQRDLMSLLNHLLVEVREVGRDIAESSSHGEESNPDILLIEDSHNLLGELRLTVINTKCEGVWPTAA